MVPTSDSEGTATRPAEVPAEVVACPTCRSPLGLGADDGAKCPSCGRLFRRLAFGWELLPDAEDTGAEVWQAWDQLQANGAVTYEADPDNNLAVGRRDDATAFARFARLEGFVLDVGCGPQRRPAYFDPHRDGTRFVGVDPLVGQSQADYPQIRALAEHLPFRDEVFDRVLFATTLDHFVDPGRALREAARVVSPSGEIAVWLGHKSPGAPPPTVSNAWYDALEVPEGAEDLFHFKRLAPEDAVVMFEAAGLEIGRREDHRVDQYRSNHFYALTPIGR